MDHFEMVEKLRTKADVTYEEAKAALELCDWDLLDAMVMLENKGKTKDQTKTNTEYSTKREKRSTREFNKDEEFDKAKGFFSGLWEGFKGIFNEGNKRSLHMYRHGHTVFEISLTMALIIFVLALLSFESFTFLFLVWLVSLFFGCRYEIKNAPPKSPSEDYDDHKQS